MRTVGAITNQSGYPYQWIRRADYASRVGDTERYTTLGNPITMRVVNNREVYELARLVLFIVQRGIRVPNITYPYDFSDRERYQRRTGQRAPYGL
jgi:hypothetical protein